MFASLEEDVPFALLHKLCCIVRGELRGRATFAEAWQ
jgi:hypothetical protein